MSLRVSGGWRHGGFAVITPVGDIPAFGRGRLVGTSGGLLAEKGDYTAVAAQHIAETGGYKRGFTNYISFLDSTPDESWCDNIASLVRSVVGLVPGFGVVNAMPLNRP